MIGIKHNGELFDLKPGSNLSFELQNLLFSNSDASRLPGSFSFPFSLPNTPDNRAKFGFSDRIDRATALLTRLNIQVLADGKELFPGVLTIREVSSGVGGEIRVDIVINPLSNVKQTPLNELDLGGDRSFANAAAVLADAKATTTAPLDYDYIYFPIWNRDFLEAGSTGLDSHLFQNFYNVTTQAFSVDDDHPILMPFVRLEYVLDRIFQDQDYTFINDWQITDELKSIVLYNNRSLWTDEGLETTINLQNHVSQTASSALIRKIMGSFCLGLFYNTWSRTLRLIPVRDLLGRAPKHDWTEKQLVPHTIATNVAQPEIICWQEDESDGAWEWYRKYPKPENVAGEVTWAEMVSGPVGNYFITDRHAYYAKAPSRILFLHQTLGCAPKEEGKPKFEAQCPALWDAFRYGEGQSAIANAKYDLIPHCRIAGTVSYMAVPPGGGDPEPVSQENDIPDRITIYRGIGPNFEDDDYPLASGIRFDGKGNEVGDYSLRWDGPNGMYESWWVGWHTMLKQGKKVTMRLNLSLTDLINFNFEDKVRIGNIDFLVEKLRVNFNDQCLNPVEATLISVI
jgi:hypothetical protein